MTDFGGELRRLLAERGISLSAAAREAGCSKGYLSNAANGRKPLTPRVAAGLDRLFGTAGTFAAYALVALPGSNAASAPSPRAGGTTRQAPARLPAAHGTLASTRGPRPALSTGIARQRALRVPREKNGSATPWPTPQVPTW